MSQENEWPYIPAYAGIPTFMHTEHTQNLDGVDMAVVGVPFDSGANSWRSGTRMGPRSIRENSLQIWGYNRHIGIAPTRELKVIDYGDIPCDPTNIDRAAAEITAVTSKIIAGGTKAAAMGGDHSISFPLIRAHAQKYGPLALVHFDAHTDTEQEENQDLHHGTPFSRAYEEGCLEPGAHIMVGIRGPVSDPEGYDQARALGAKILTIEECFSMGTAAIIEAIRSQVGDRQVYVTLDIDALDPAYAPGTGTPEVGGFNSFQMLQLVRGLEGLNIIGCDLVEVNPLYDHGAITSILAANLLFELLSVMGKPFIRS